MPQYSFRIVPEHPRGEFRPDSFDHLMQQRVHVPGLDMSHNHVLIDAQVEPGGGAATLTINTDPAAPTRQLRGAFRLVNGTPTCKVVLLKADDPHQELLRTQLDAPLQAGQRVALGEQEYIVAGTEWPMRDPNTGICVGAVDWQHAHLTPVDPIGDFPLLADAPIRPEEATRLTGGASNG